MDSSEKKLALGLFQIIERILLFIVVLMTLGGVAFELHSLYIACLLYTSPSPRD